MTAMMSTQAGDSGRPEVDLRELLVPAVTPQAANRLAAARQRDEQPKAGHDDKPDKADCQLPAHPAHEDHDAPEG